MLFTYQELKVIPGVKGASRILYTFAIVKIGVLANIQSTLPIKRTKTKLNINYEADYLGKSISPCRKGLFRQDPMKITCSSIKK